MKNRWMTAFVVMGLASCSSFDPLDKRHGLYQGHFRAKPGAGVTAQFLGNTTIHVSDGTTDLLVDGYFTRPNGLKVLGIGKIAPDESVIRQQLELAEISKIDAILVGHSHADHALDAPTIAKMKEHQNTMVMGNVSYHFIHKGEGANTDRAHLFMVPCHGTEQKFGKFTVTFVASEHITPRNFVQKRLEGEITAPLKTPAPFSSFKCGEVYAIHIKHPDGNLLITTTAGAKCGALDRYRADVAFLGIGLLGKECPCKMEHYWKETVDAVKAQTIVPVHWDNFSRKLRDDKLVPVPWFTDNLGKTMGWIQCKAGKRQVLLMGLRDSFRLRNGAIQ